jgi:hemolysin III
MLVYGLTMIGLLTVSASYHLRTWRPRMRAALRALDHASIFLLIAGTYTPVATISLAGAWRVGVLVGVWSGAAAAAISKICWVTAPKWLSAVFGIALGWVGVLALPQLAHREGIAPVVLIAAGGLAYTAGAVVYALRRPDPLPRVFGYHELFHAMTIVALACQYTAIAFFVVHVA